MPPKRMTANPVRPARYRPGKPTAAESESSGDESSDEDAEGAGQEPVVPLPPKAASFPSDSTRIANNLKKVDLNERREQAAAREAARVEAQAAERAKEEEGFVTEESEDESQEEDESGSESEEETSDEEEEPKKVLLRPTFIKKDKRAAIATKAVAAGKLEEEKRMEEEERRKAAADEIVEEQLRRDAAARAAGKKFWDDDEGEDADAVDDTDGLDPETERALWKLRELKRVKRERETIEQAEKEREEVERRRNLSKEEREEEDREFMARQREEKESRGKAGYLQKYYHKGAFFQDDQKEMGLDKRDIMGSRYQDEVANRELLPQYMQVRDMTRLGKKGRTKYKDLKGEDTGKWGEYDDRGQRRGDDRKGFGGMRDERFMPDYERDRERRAERTGANASEVRERKRVEGAPEGPRSMRDGGGNGRDRDDKTDSYRPGGPDRERRDPREDDNRHTSRDYRGRDMEYHREYSPRRRSRSRHDHRYRDRHGDDRDRRKRSNSPYGDRDDRDKRRKVDAK
ncbi:hypothetical protein FGG08_000264 [Glutinoglossum americanum]|uniref:Micro-fibrillar-associated protein 1 C-terminal domain-containing protein n=1 Tax=Glutinoglossum americanum TaxID=1670608 RepID=A0A9P8IDH4_9PEZI|nr:hypothetical protein FGG08_000264 [Glutinoglossum americanum]